MLDQMFGKGASQKVITLTDQISGMRTDLATQTKIMAAMTDAMDKRDAKARPLPIFLDLTLAQPSLSIGDTLDIVDGWLSAAGPQQFVIHIGEMGVFFVHWYLGGLDRIFPLNEKYPLPVNRSDRIWIEQHPGAPNDPNTDFFIKLVAFPVRSPHGEG